MGAVYLAERSDAQFAHRVAIKILDFGIADRQLRPRGSDPDHRVRDPRLWQAAAAGIGVIVRSPDRHPCI